MKSDLETSFFPHGGYGRIIAKRFGIDVGTLLDLSASLNPFAPNLRPMLRGLIDGGALERYPDALDLEYATEALATALGIDGRRLLLTAGGAEAIALVGKNMGSLTFSNPEFSLYGRYAKKDDFSAAKICSDPNNPLGTLAEPSSDNTKPVIWDEAFYPLSTGLWTRKNFGPQDLVLGSLTKTFACPGLRLGFILFPNTSGAALGHEKLFDELQRSQIEWSRTPLSLMALPKMLEIGTVGRWNIDCRDLKKSIEDFLLEIGIETISTGSAPWILIRASSDFGEKLAPSGVVLRDCQSFGLLSTFRMGLPKTDEMDRVLVALEKVSKQEGPM